MNFDYSESDLRRMERRRPYPSSSKFADDFVKKMLRPPLLCRCGIHGWRDGGWLSTQMAVSLARMRDGAKGAALYTEPWPERACVRCGVAKRA